MEPHLMLKLAKNCFHQSMCKQASTLDIYALAQVTGVTQSVWPPYLCEGILVPSWFLLHNGGIVPSLPHSFSICYLFFSMFPFSLRYLDVRISIWMICYWWILVCMPHTLLWYITRLLNRHYAHNIIDPRLLIIISF